LNSVHIVRLSQEEQDLSYDLERLRVKSREDRMSDIEFKQMESAMERIKERREKIRQEMF